jgi:type II secretion system protein N
MAERVAGDVRSVRRPVVIAVLAAGALLIFAVFLIASFPYDEMASTMLAPYRLKLHYRAQHLHLPIGVALDGVDLVSIASSPSQLLLQSPAIALRPTLGSLLLGRPGLGLDAQIYRGTLHAIITQEAGAIGVTFDAHALSLDESQLLSQFGALLGGTLSAGGSAQIHGPILADNTGQATIDGRDVTVAITRGFPLIHLGTVSGQILLANGVVSFHDFETHGGDVESKADGTIQLAPDPADSTIAARVYLTPTPGGLEHFGLLFHMLPHPPAEGPYEVRGPLLGPSIS